jgi:hypothetical protein
MTIFSENVVNMHSRMRRQIFANAARRPAAEAQYVRIMTASQPSDIVMVIMGRLKRMGKDSPASVCVSDGSRVRFLRASEREETRQGG